MTIDWFDVELRHDGAVEESREARAYVESLQAATLARFGYSLGENECFSWLEADATVDQAVGWINHGCGPGDMLGCWTRDPEEAFP